MTDVERAAAEYAQQYLMPSYSEDEARGKLKRSFLAGVQYAEQRANEKLRVAREALESIAFGEQPRADDFKFWLQKGSAEAAETLAEDTHIARSALKALED